MVAATWLTQCSATVSYTHLDVYKRQCLLMALALLPALAMAEEAVTMPEVAASIDWTALVVDVYKRQA